MKGAAPPYLPAPQQSGGSANAFDISVAQRRREGPGKPAATANSDDLRIVRKRAAVELKAWQALARYKFWMFGYHAAQWVLLTQQLGDGWPNPFKLLVKAARVELKAREMFDVNWPPTEHGDAWNWPVHLQDGTRELYRQQARELEP